MTRTLTEIESACTELVAAIRAVRRVGAGVLAADELDQLRAAQEIAVRHAVTLPDDDTDARPPVDDRARPLVAGG